MQFFSFAEICVFLNKELYWFRPKLRFLSLIGKIEFEQNFIMTLISLFENLLVGQNFKSIGVSIIKNFSNCRILNWKIFFSDEICKWPWYPLLKNFEPEQNYQMIWVKFIEIFSILTKFQTDHVILKILFRYKTSSTAWIWCLK